MPQGRRKKPFSGKQKREQISLKRQTKETSNRNVLLKKANHRNPDSSSDSDDEGAGPSRLNVEKINDQKTGRSRYALQFQRETEKEIQHMKSEARKPLQVIMPKDLEFGDEFFVGFDFPVRQEWSYNTPKEILEMNEQKYFREYIEDLFKQHSNEKGLLSYCELNLETWRQLWRVLELSDIVLLIVDIRYAIVQFPPFLFDYVTKTLKKHLILVINKIDLVEPHLILAWKTYFEEKYQGIHVVLFTSYSGHARKSDKHGLKIRRRRGLLRMAWEGARQVLCACKEVVQKNDPGAGIDFTSWEQKIRQESLELDSVDGDSMLEVDIKQPQAEYKAYEYVEHVKYKNGLLSIGCVGFPNVGKSSLLNALMGKKVVSVSKTPGHTKHFQTIFLTDNVKICDCPGLAFPSSAPRALQVLAGSYPIAQLRQPYNAVKFLAERINLPLILNIKRDGSSDADEQWSAMEICDLWALKRGYLTAKAARPDTYRAANSILRMALEGKISLCLRPVAFHSNEEMWRNHPKIPEIIEIQGREKVQNVPAAESKDGESESESNPDEEEDEGNECFGFANSSNAFSLLNDD